MLRGQLTAAKRCRRINKQYAWSPTLRSKFLSVIKERKKLKEVIRRNEKEGGSRGDAPRAYVRRILGDVLPLHEVLGYLNELKRP